ncbi:helix-turn-helix domain-containing protein [Streptomyces narbonensis]|uniref:Helix-turn-helix domain-containing protein n=1 Tax=Streptomyces narbonensis TaxID=67333 RepID=A0ABV3C6I5_9ACTN
MSSVLHSLVLLEAVAEHGEIAAKRLSREARLPLPTTYHLLRTPVHDGYLRRERGAFRLGPAVPGCPAGCRGPSRA